MSKLLPCLFNFHAEYIMQNAGLNDSQAGIKIAGRKIKGLKYADNTTLMAESWEELKSRLMRMKEKNERTGLKLSIQKTKIIASDPITSWQIDGEKVEAVAYFLFLDLKIMVDGDCSREIRRYLLVGRKAMTNLDGVLKSKDITLPAKVPIVKVLVISVVMYECENWTIKKAECQRILDIPLDCKIKPAYPKGNQPWIFIGRINAEIEAPILGHLC